MSKSNLYYLLLALFLAVSCKERENKVKINISAVANATSKIRTSKIAFNRDSVFLDSIICHFNNQDSFWVDSITFYNEGHSYVNTNPNISYRDEFGANNFHFLQWNNDSFLDLSYHSGSSGQGCFNEEIYLYNPTLCRYDHNVQLSEECSLTFNPKLNIYSTYSRGGGQSGPWSYEIFKLNNKKIIIIESLQIEKETVENMEKDKWIINHKHKGKNHIYKYFLKENYFEYYNPPTYKDFIVLTKNSNKPFYNPKL